MGDAAGRGEAAGVARAETGEGEGEGVDLVVEVAWTVRSTEAAGAEAGVGEPVIGRPASMSSTIFDSSAWPLRVFCASSRTRAF